MKNPPTPKLKCSKCHTLHEVYLYGTVLFGTMPLCDKCVREICENKEKYMGREEEDND